MGGQPLGLQVYVNDEYQFGDFLDAMDVYRQSAAAIRRWPATCTRISPGTSVGSASPVAPS